ncbi:hypothetical protein KC341_g59 [Hortaea werneckii]|nr:hypothetical protein KC341_g59 [Hortaea werneckii]
MVLRVKSGIDATHDPMGRVFSAISMHEPCSAQTSVKFLSDATASQLPSVVPSIAFSFFRAFSLPSIVAFSRFSQFLANLASRRQEGAGPVLPPTPVAVVVHPPAFLWFPLRSTGPAGASCPGLPIRSISAAAGKGRCNWRRRRWAGGASPDGDGGQAEEAKEAHEEAGEHHPQLRRAGGRPPVPSADHHEREMAVAHAARRRRSWTPVMDTAIHVPSPAPRVPLGELLSNFSYTNPNPGGTSRSGERIISGEATTKRRKIELADSSTSAPVIRQPAKKASKAKSAKKDVTEKASESTEMPPAKPAKRSKGPKKPQTITALATKAYQPLVEPEAEQSTNRQSSRSHASHGSEKKVQTRQKNPQSRKLQPSPRRQKRRSNSMRPTSYLLSTPLRKLYCRCNSKISSLVHQANSRRTKIRNLSKNCRRR